MSMSYDTAQLVVMMLQWLGTSQQPWRINGEVEGLSDSLPQGMSPLWTFQRYDAPLEMPSYYVQNTPDEDEGHGRRLCALCGNRIV